MERSKAYSPGTSPKLSQLFEKKLIMCAEIATLAQKYFKNKGYKVYLVNGGIVAELDKENWGDSQAHSFLLFEQEDWERIFDPSMPIKYNGKGYPHIIKIPDQLSFLEHFKKDQLIAIKDPKFNLYYGNGAGAQTTLYEENILKTPSAE